LEGLDGKAATLEDDRITLEGLRKYTDEQMENDPDHQPTYCGAGMRQADKIVLARASRLQGIYQKLQVAEKCLKIGHPEDAFAAVKILGEVIPRCARLERASNLKSDIDQKLSQYRNALLGFLQDTRLEVGYQFTGLYPNLRQLARDLSVDTFLRQDASTQGLLISLCEAYSQALEVNPNDFDTRRRPLGSRKR
jgi:hypothetical protein